MKRPVWPPAVTVALSLTVAIGVSGVSSGGPEAIPAPNGAAPAWQRALRQHLPGLQVNPVVFPDGHKLGPWPSVSPTGKWIGAVHVYPQGDPKESAAAPPTSLRLYQPNGDYIRDLTTRRFSRVESRWTWSHTDNGIFIVNQNGEVWKITLPGASVHYVSPEGGLPPVFSPTGNSYLDMRTTDPDGRPEYWLYNVSTRSGKERFLGHAYRGQWSPDGRRVLFPAKPGGVKPREGWWIVRPDGRDAKRLLGPPELKREARERNWHRASASSGIFAWVAKPRSILTIGGYVPVVGQRMTWGIWVVGLSGGTLAFVPGVELVSGSLDGRHFLFSTSVGRTTNYYFGSIP